MLSVRFVWSFFGVAMELYWVVGVFLLVWLALAVVCVRKGRAGWIVLAIFLPIPVTIVASLVAGIIVRPQQTGGLGDFSRAFAAMGVAAGIGVVSSYIVLAVGATRPRADPTVDSRAAPPGIAHLIGGGRPKSEDSIDSSGDGDQESDV